MSTTPNRVIINFISDSSPPPSPPPPLDDGEHPEIARQMSWALIPRPLGAVDQLHVLGWDFSRQQHLLFREASNTWERLVWLLGELGFDHPSEREVQAFALGWICRDVSEGRLKLRPPFDKSDGIARLAKAVVGQAKLMSTGARPGEDPHVEWLRQNLVVYFPGSSLCHVADAMTSVEIGDGWWDDHPEEAGRGRRRSLEMKLSASMKIAFAAQLAKGDLVKGQVTSAHLAGWIGLRWSPSRQRHARLQETNRRPLRSSIATRETRET